MPARKHAARRRQRRGCMCESLATPGNRLGAQSSGDAYEAVSALNRAKTTTENLTPALPQSCACQCPGTRCAGALACPCSACNAQAETAYTRACLADTEELQKKLYAEMRGAIQEADQTAPVRCEWAATCAGRGPAQPQCASGCPCKGTLLWHVRKCKNVRS